MKGPLRLRCGVSRDVRAPRLVSPRAVGLAEADRWADPDDALVEMSPISVERPVSLGPKCVSPRHEDTKRERFTWIQERPKPRAPRGVGPICSSERAAFLSLGVLMPLRCACFFGLGLTGGAALEGSQKCRECRGSGTSIVQDAPSPPRGDGKSNVTSRKDRSIRADHRFEQDHLWPFSPHGHAKPTKSLSGEPGPGYAVGRRVVRPTP